MGLGRGPAAAIQVMEHFIRDGTMLCYPRKMHQRTLKDLCFLLSPPLDEEPVDLIFLFPDPIFLIANAPELAPRAGSHPLIPAHSSLSGGLASGVEFATAALWLQLLAFPASPREVQYAQHCK